MGAHWSIIHSLPSSKAILLKSFLSKKFPKSEFEITRFENWSKVEFSKQAGCILELKEIERADLRSLDSLWRRVKGLSCLIILTPETYQLLKKSRPKLLEHASIILSDLKSLDYIPQLPRWIESARRKDHLKFQNERLQRLMDKMKPADSRDIAEDLLDGLGGSPYCGLRVSLKRWDALKKQIGMAAYKEVVETISRIINSAVRNSDRVLHWKEDEFLIFLSNAEPRHLNHCRTRVEELLSSLSLSANQRPVSIPFAVRSVEQMAFIN